MAALTVSCNMFFCVLCMQCNALYYTVLKQILVHEHVNDKLPSF